jgi:hypothetical protein
VDLWQTGHSDYFVRKPCTQHGCYSSPDSSSISGLGPGADHVVERKLIDSMLAIVLQNGEREIARELASPTDALRVALMMLARRERLEIGDELKVLPPI